MSSCDGQPEITSCDDSVEIQKQVIKCYGRCYKNFDLSVKGKDYLTPADFEATYGCDITNGTPIYCDPDTNMLYGPPDHAEYVGSAINAVDTRFTTNVKTMLTDQFVPGPLIPAVITNPNQCRPVRVVYDLTLLGSVFGLLGESWATTFRYSFDRGDGILTVVSTGSSSQLSHNATTVPLEQQRETNFFSTTSSNIIPAGASLNLQAQVYIHVTAGNQAAALTSAQALSEAAIRVTYRMSTLL